MTFYQTSGQLSKLLNRCCGYVSSWLPTDAASRLRDDMAHRHNLDCEYHYRTVWGGRPVGPPPTPPPIRVLVEPVLVGYLSPPPTPGSTSTPPAAVGGSPADQPGVGGSPVDTAPEGFCPCLDVCTPPAVNTGPVGGTPAESPPLAGNVVSTPALSAPAPPASRSSELLLPEPQPCPESALPASPDEAKQRTVQPASLASATALRTHRARPRAFVFLARRLRAATSVQRAWRHRRPPAGSALCAACVALPDRRAARRDDVSIPWRVYPL